MKILLVVLDGLGDRPAPALGGRTPLEAASTPNLDALAREGQIGLLNPKGPGIPLGSPLAHHIMFGYPEEKFPDRAVLLAVARDFAVDYEDVALAARFASVVEEDGHLRPVQRFIRGQEEDCTALAGAIAHYETDGLAFRYRHWGKGEGILYIAGGASPDITDSDPLGLDLPIIKVEALALARDPEAAQRTAAALNRYLAWAHHQMSHHPVAERRQRDGRLPINFLITKWSGRRVRYEPFGQRYGLRAASLPAEEVVDGLMREMDIDVLTLPDDDDAKRDLRHRLEIARDLLARGYDFVHLHTKEPDPTAHYCDPAAKQEKIEALDRGFAYFWQHLAQTPDLITAVTSDHSTPSTWASHQPGQFIDLHGGEPVPIVLRGGNLRRDDVAHFSEGAAVYGALGHIRGADLMPLLLNAAECTNLYGMRPTPYPHLYRPRRVEPFRLPEV